MNVTMQSVMTVAKHNIKATCDDLEKSFNMPPGCIAYCLDSVANEMREKELLNVMLEKLSDKKDVTDENCDNP